MSDATFNRVEFLQDRLDYLQGVIDEYAIAATTLDDPDNVTLENVERHSDACDALLDAALSATLAERAMASTSRRDRDVHKGDIVTPAQYEAEFDFTARRDALAYAIGFIRDNKPFAVVNEEERKRFVASAIDDVLPLAAEFYEFLRGR